MADFIGTENDDYIDDGRVSEGVEHSTLDLSGDDRIWGHGGDDLMWGGYGNDLMYGGAGKDTFGSQYGNNEFFGEAGDDYIYAGYGNDELYGGVGDDHLFNSGGVSRLYGGVGNDLMTGTGGVTYLYGGSGDDDLDGQNMFGGAGNDSYRVLAENNFIFERPGDGVDTVTTGVDGYVLPDNVENLTLTSSGRVKTNYGNEIDNVIIGSRGHSIIYGAAGNDIIRDDDGTPYGGNQNGSNDMLYGGAGNDGVFAGDGADEVHGDDGNDRVGGGAHDDMVYGGAGNDRLTGDNHNDVLYGGTGNDVLDGGSVRDTMYGGAGDDLIYGGVGIDVLDGGAGDDWFVYDDVSWSSPGRNDRVAGFDAPGDPGGDVFDLSGIDADTTLAGMQDFAFGGAQGAGPLTTATGYFWFVNSGSNTLLRANSDGDAAADLEVIIVDGTGVTASDYTGLDVIG